MFNNRSRPQLPQDDHEIDLLKPYLDNPEDEETTKIQNNTDAPLPSYEPMYDYLRRQNPLFLTTVATSSSHPVHNNTCLSPSLVYTDQPFVVNLAYPEAPPPSYDIIRQQHEFEMQSLRGIFVNRRGDSFLGEEDEEEGDEEEDDEEEDDALQIEDLVKWVVVMFMISLMVAFIGTLFDWGRSPQYNKALRRDC